MSLVLDGISKHFGGVVAADDVHLALPSRMMTGVIGPNGAGKTTLVNLITGLLRASAGRIMLGDRELTHLSATAVARSGVARTFQNIRLLGQASVLDNVMLGFHRKEGASMLAALLADGGVTDPAVARALRDDLLAAHRDHLPQFA